LFIVIKINLILKGIGELFDRITYKNKCIHLILYLFYCCAAVIRVSHAIFYPDMGKTMVCWSL